LQSLPILGKELFKGIPNSHRFPAFAFWHMQKRGNSSDESTRRVTQRFSRSALSPTQNLIDSICGGAQRQRKTRS
jgi:hypothetical protein